MLIRVDGATYRGDGVDVHHDVTPSMLVEAIRSACESNRHLEARTTAVEDRHYESRTTTGIGADTCETVAVRCPRPGPGHGPLAVIPGPFAVRMCLAAAARSRGYSTSVDDEIAAVRRELDSLSIPTVDLESARRRVADVRGEVTRLRERVATLRGRLQAHRTLEVTPEEIEVEYRDAVTTLSAIETEEVAAREELACAEQRAQKARDVRNRRIRLQDRLENLHRRARALLTERVSHAFRHAVTAIPGPSNHSGTSVEDSLLDFDGDRLTASLAAVRIADLSAPVVLSLVPPRFETAHDAASCLQGPVIRCGPATREHGSKRDMPVESVSVGPAQ